MVMVANWSGREAQALRVARRMSVRAFAAHLGMAKGSVVNWEQRGELARLRPETQEILDRDLSLADANTRERFETALAGSALRLAAPDAQERFHTSPAASRERGSTPRGQWGPLLGAAPDVRVPATAVVSLLPGHGSAWAARAGSLGGGTGGPAREMVLVAQPGRYFDGATLDAHVVPAVSGGELLHLPPAQGDRRYLRAGHPDVVLAATSSSTGGQRLFALDGRQARRRARRDAGGQAVVPRAYELDDLTCGILWAVANLDRDLLDDDTALTQARQRLSSPDGLPPPAGRELVDELSGVSQMWLGSSVCAGYILNHLDALGDVPVFWTREQCGEEAAAWLLFTHKFEYLDAVTRRFAGTGLRRAFCIPPHRVTASPPAERILLLLAIALMESFHIHIDVCPDPAYAAVDGFVLDSGHRAILANWVGADELFHVDVTAHRPLLAEYADADGYAATHSTVDGATPGRRLAALAAYLDLDWPWLVRRCQQLGAYGAAGLAAPRSRLLGLAGVDRACQYLGRAGQSPR